MRDRHSVLDSNGMPDDVPAVHADRLGGCAGPRSRSRAPGGEPAADAARVRVRQLRRQHDAAVVQPYSPGTALSRRLPPLQTARDDRRPPHRRRRRLGVVLGRLGERRRRHRATRATRTGGANPARRPAAPTRTSTPASERRTSGALAVLPGRALPVPPPAVQLLRELRAGHARTRAPAGRGRLRRASRRSSTRTCNLKPRQLRQADRRGERASRLREHA